MQSASKSAMGAWIALPHPAAREHGGDRPARTDSLSKEGADGGWVGVISARWRVGWGWCPRSHGESPKGPFLGRDFLPEADFFGESGYACCDVRRRVGYH